MLSLCPSRQKLTWQDPFEPHTQLSHCRQPLSRHHASHSPPVPNMPTLKPSSHGRGQMGSFRNCSTPNDDVGRVLLACYACDQEPFMRCGFSAAEADFASAQARPRNSCTWECVMDLHSERPMLTNLLNIYSLQRRRPNTSTIGSKGLLTFCRRSSSLSRDAI